MKKYISLALALVMLLSLGLLSACSNGAETTPAVSETTPSESAAATSETVQATGAAINAVQAKLDAGEKVFIGFAMETVSNPFFLAQADFLKTSFEEMNVNFEYIASEGDNALMISQIENYITMGADLIMCAPPDPSAVKDALLKAEDAGIPVVIMGNRPDFGDQLSGGTYLTWYDVGYAVGKMASAWIDKVYPDAKEGEIHAADLTYNAVNIFVQQHEGLMAAVKEDPRISITFLKEDLDTLDEGYNAAEAALTTDPDIKLFLSYQESPAVGASNYIIAQPGFDKAKYAAFAAGIQSMGTEQLELSKTDQSIYRGVIAYGTYGAEGVEIPSAAGLFYVTRDVLLGTAPVMPYWSEDDRWALTSFGYEYKFDNPLNDFLIETYSTKS